MKYLAPALLITLVLIACGGDGPSATATPPTLTVGSTAWAPDGSTLTLHTVERPATDTGSLSLSTPAANTELLAVDVEECAGNRVPADKPLMPYDGDFHLVMVDNTRVLGDRAAIKRPVFGDDVIAAGECLRGWIVFLVPIGSNVKSLSFDGNASTSREWHATFMLSQ